MADIITTLAAPSSATPTLKAFFYNNNSEIANNGSYVQGTGVDLTNEAFSNNILDADDIGPINFDAVTFDQIRVMEGASEVVRFDLPVEESYAGPVNYTYPWPVNGVLFASGEVAVSTYSFYPKYFYSSLDVTVKAMLLSSAFAGFNKNHEFVSDIVTDEIDVTGYARQEVPGSLILDALGVYFTPDDDISFPAMTTDDDVQYLVFYADIGTDSQNKLMSIKRFDTGIALDDETFDVTFSGAIFAAYCSANVALPTVAMLEFEDVTTDKADTETIQIPIVLSRTQTFEITLKLLIEGGKSDLEPYGNGVNYTTDESGAGWYRSLDATAQCGYKTESTYKTITFAPGDYSKTVEITIVNNPNFELDRVMTLSLIDPSGCNVLGGNKYITIEDNNAYGIVLNAVTDYATWGGSAGLVAGSEAAATDNKTVLQDIMTYVRTQSSNDPTTWQAAILIPQGEYYFEHDMRFWPGVMFVTNQNETVTLRRPSKTWYVDNSIPVADGGYYAYAMFRWLGSGGTNVWTGTTDSKATGFRGNFIFDSAYDTFTPFTPYTLFEQSTMVEFSKSSTGAGKMVTLLEGAIFQNDITTHVSYVSNVVINAYNWKCNGGVPGKGDYSLVGGNLAGTFREIDCSVSGRHVDWEQTGATTGYYTDSRIDTAHYYCKLNDLQLGMSSTAAGPQSNIFEWCDIGNFGPYCLMSTITFTNCNATLDTYGSAEDTAIQRVKTFLWTSNVVGRGVITINPPATGNAGIPLQFQSMTNANTVTFTNATFIKGDGTFPGTCDGLSYKFGNYTSTPTGPLVTLNNATFTGDFDYPLHLHIGGNIVVNGITFTGAKSTSALFNLFGYDTNGYNFKAVITGPVVSDAPIYLASQMDAAGTGNKLYHAKLGGVPTVQLTKANSLIKSTTAYTYITGWDCDGTSTYGRLITDTGAVPATGLKGDTYNDGSTNHTCTTSGVQKSSGAYTYAIWS